jgi:hypothetical protein
MGPRSPFRLFHIGVIAAALAAYAAPATADDIPAALAALDHAEALSANCPMTSSMINIRSWAYEARLALQTNNIFMATTLMKTINDALDRCISFAKSIESEKQKCRGPIRIGMSALQVLSSEWCRPNHINTTTTAGHQTEQWVYRTDLEPLRGLVRHRGYLYITDGVLTAIQEEN